MDSQQRSLCFISLAFLFITCSSAEFLIQQVTQGRGTENNSSYSLDANLGVTRVLRDERPSSKIVTIAGYSVIKGRGEPYESSVFEAAGYKWRLVLYVVGNANDGGAGYISLYVRIEETESLPFGWELNNVDLKLFVHNPKLNKYLTVTASVSPPQIVASVSDHRTISVSSFSADFVMLGFKPRCRSHPPVSVSLRKRFRNNGYFLCIATQALKPLDILELVPIFPTSHRAPTIERRRWKREDGDGDVTAARREDADTTARREEADTAALWCGGDVVTTMKQRHARRQTGQESTGDRKKAQWQRRN
ncbi:hypothetical protein F2Q70_00018649 [Brassica cretica]|uniref:MATH domain-containing protein n=1 Tax=Brassica cretica TaxID=69181 RepID=A0A8S9HTY2_BRACR|nr:hypothetical protein F2Q70_00018649 [Brassica cretica]